ncbi:MULTISPECIES: sulfurtransferase TusA family protein [Rhizobium/Agrobacterium group]|uniref:Sulfurtransferase TusA family protein n=2 Tax=Agrobacterium tumefaciens complex TaxID=1183400 RepID=A0AAE6ELV2_AGRTU|nr:MULTISPECIES: sulfurtransferase TusA family protein [Rhizobium/Agrobacterium group]KNY33209.1 response regulator SirA [Agrobacterium sp. SUL3]KRA68834.1 response regulator SirA [Rhizobium sp. Root651]MBP8939758.1 sulfurtransferase TusA family protein [Agrobacterium sp.]MCA2372083.1 sulfurtransferase TusA family protein [Agrobacterium tomkonis CIP 111-78]MCD4663316.1 sulfurtransferase TusA family protein [Agrobacterium sp.]
MSDTAEIIFDLRGLKCPLPVLRSRKKLAALKAGDILTIETTDPLAVIDIAHMCNEDGHNLLETTAVDKGHRFRIVKGG